MTVYPSQPEKKFETVPLRSDGLTQDEYRHLQGLIIYQGSLAVMFRSGSLAIAICSFLFAGWLWAVDPYNPASRDGKALKLGIFSTVCTLISAAEMERRKRAIVRKFRQKVDVDARKGKTTIEVPVREKIDFSKIRF